MPTYSYKVRNQTGEIISGVIDAPTTDAVAEQLFSKGYTPVKIEAEEETKSPIEKGWQIFDRVKDEDLIVFSRQLATLITAGISFIRSMDTLAEQTKSRKLRKIIEEIRREVARGSSFSDALAKFPKVFSPLYISMVRVGEEAGVLDDILNRLSSLLEHDATTRARVKAATRYPVIVIISMIIAFFVLTTFVVPKFASLYQSAKVELPLPTRVLIFLNKAIRTYWPLLIAAVAGVIFAFRGYIRTPSGRWNLDKLKLRVPIIGSVVEKTVMSRFARIFSTLYSSGIPMLHALDIVAGTLGNIIIARAVEVIKESVREGKGLAVPMASTMVFPPMVTQMVAVGEETGALDDMLTKVADYYDLEVEYAIKNLSITLEPVLLVFLAGGILFLALGIFLPIWDMMKVMKR
ncbi:MAG: type II secretion system F family protein [Nitrospirae bacterium]|nr:type II secretion system F family protein [Nitrospirota bacterium]MBI3377620.1 type II secretion system F family protein [Nitrospirota bacterium]